MTKKKNPETVAPVQQAVPPPPPAPAAPVPDLSTMTREQLVEYCRTRIHSSARSAWEAGYALTVAKSKKDKYGEWLPFLQAVGISKASDWRYRELASRYSDPSKMPTDLCKAYKECGLWRSHKKDSDQDKSGSNDWTEGLPPAPAGTGTGSGTGNAPPDSSKGKGKGKGGKGGKSGGKDENDIPLPSLTPAKQAVADILNTTTDVEDVTKRVKERPTEYASEKIHIVEAAKKLRRLADELEQFAESLPDVAPEQAAAA